MGRWSHKKKKTAIATCLFISGIALVCASQWCVTRHFVNINDVAVTDDGEVFAIVSVDHWYRTEIWKWSHDLSTCEKLLRTSGRAWGLACSNDGEFLLALLEDGLFKYDCLGGERVWREPLNKDSWQAIDVHLSEGNRYLIVVDGWAQVFRNRRRADRISIFDARDGRLIGEKRANSSIRRIDSLRDLVRYSTDQTREVIDLSTGQIEKSDAKPPLANPDWRSHQVNVVPRDIHSSESLTALSGSRQVLGMKCQGLSPAEIRVTNRKTRKTRSVSLSKTREQMAVFWAVVAGAIAFWAYVFWNVFDWKSQGRVLYGFACMCILLILCCTNLAPLVATDRYENALPTTAMAIGAALLVLGLFATTMVASRPLYLWIVFYLGCAVPFVLPLIVSGFLMRWVGISVPFRDTIVSRLPTKSWVLRFEIQHMLLATAAIAVFAGTGIHFVMMSPATFVWISVMILGTVLLSIVFARTSDSAALFVVIGVFLIGVLQGVYRMHTGEKAAYLFVLVIFMTIACARARGYRAQWGSTVAIEEDSKSP